MDTGDLYELEYDMIIGRGSQKSLGIFIVFKHQILWFGDVTIPTNRNKIVNKNKN